MTRFGRLDGDRIEIPVRSSVLAVAPQIELRDTTAADFLDEVAGITRSPQEMAEKDLAQRVRKNKGVANQLQAFLHEYPNRMRERFIDWVQTLPIRDGDIDLDALGKSQSDLIEEMKKIMPASSPQDIIEEFLAKQDSRAASEE